MNTSELIVLIGVITMVLIFAVTCISIYLREIVPLSFKAKKDNDTIETKIDIKK